MTGFTTTALRLSWNGGGNLLTTSQTLTTTDNRNWTLGNLAGLTATAGAYTLTLVALGSTITDAYGNPLSTNASGTWVLGTLPTVTTSPSNQTVVAGGTASFTAAAGGNPAPSVQWDVSSDGGTTFSPISGATATTYSFTTSAAENGYQYEAVFTNTAGNATTAAATLTVDYAPSVTTSPSNQTVVAGGTASFTAVAGGNPAPSVQWDVSSDGGTTFSPISGATSTTCSWTTNAAENGYQYEAVFTNTVGNATTAAATLTVNYAPSVTTSPSNQTVVAGGTASFTAVAGGNPAPSVQWDVSSDGGTTFSPISGATSTTYSFTTSAAENGYQYEAVFTNSVNSATTTAATLTVNPVIPVATVAVWNSAGSGVWNSAGNWIDTQGTGAPGFSGVTGDQATFNGAAGLNADLGNFSPNIAGLTFGPGALNYDITSSGSGVLQLNNGSSNATITVSAGSQTIDAPVQLFSNTAIAPAASATLNISGPISGAASSLTLDGGGTLVLSGANSYGGGTIVLAGILQVTSSGGVPPGGSLTVGAGGIFVFGSSLTAAAGSSASSLSARGEQSSAPPATGSQAALAAGNTRAAATSTSFVASPGVAVSSARSDQPVGAIVPAHEVATTVASVEAAATISGSSGTSSPMVQSQLAAGMALLSVIRDKSFAAARNSIPGPAIPQTWGIPAGTASARAHDAVLQSRNAVPSVEEEEAAAFCTLDDGRGDSKHDSIDSAVDAVIAMLERM